MKPVLGLDFDNTLIRYDDVFFRVAREKDLIPDTVGRDKQSVKQFLIEANKEDRWTELQGEVYGPRISEAEMFDGALQIIQFLERAGVEIYLISHKTRTPYLGEAHDLHAAARTWLDENKFFSPDGANWLPSQIFFELTKKKKINRVIQQQCTHFLDDLPEILELLPESVKRIRFAPDTVKSNPASGPWHEIRHWRDLPSLVL